MAVRTARFAHCIARRPVEYRAKSPFHPAISAPLDFSARVGELYTLDHELDRAILRPEDYTTIVHENLDDTSPESRWLDDAPEGPRSSGSAQPAERRRPLNDRQQRRLAENHVRLGRESARFRPPWTVGLVQDAHALLFQGVDLAVVPGTFRQRPFLATDPEGEPMFRTCPPDRMVGDLQAVLDWVDRYGATYHPLIPATVLFQAVYSIRPFSVGSTTVGRMLAQLYLRYFGLPNIAMTPATAVSLASPELTYQLLLWAEATGSYTELLDHTLDSVVHAYAVANRRWLGDSDPAHRLEEVQLRLLARARREAGWFSAREAMRWVGATSDQTVLRHLNRLVSRGILESLGRTRGKRFRVAPPASAAPPSHRSDPFSDTAADEESRSAIVGVEETRRASAPHHPNR